MQSTTQDAFGGQVNTWTDVANVWAEIITLEGRELLAAQAVHNESRYKIRMRGISGGVNPAWRVKFGSRYFNILNAMNTEERGIECQLLCSEGL
jgi:SPP1 family predicted phage head-tail adaptor